MSIKMAKTQNLSLNPTKISGTCGRLMCCLKYEQTAYEDASKRVPKNESFVDTPDGIGNVSGVDLLREQVQVRLDSAPESPRRYKASEIRVLRSGKGSREGIEIPAERPARDSAPEAEPEPRSRFSHRPGREPIPVSSVLAGKAPQEEEERRNRRRSRSGGRKGGGQSADRQSPRQEKPEKAPRPESSRPPQRAEKQPRPDNRPPRADRPVRVDKAEKLPVRTATDTTAEKKAAADRAARQQAGGQEGKSGANRRRPRRRPRGKGEG